MDTKPKCTSSLYFIKGISHNEALTATISQTVLQNECRGKSTSALTEFHHTNHSLLHATYTAVKSNSVYITICNVYLFNKLDTF